MSFFSTPDHAVAALAAGVLLLYVEANRPGSIVPGCAGLLTILLALHGLSAFSITAAGVVWLAAGAALVVAAIFGPARGLSSLLAAAALSAGFLTLVATPHRVGAAVALPVGAGLAWISARLGRIGLLARRLKRAGAPPLELLIHEPAGTDRARGAERVRLDTHLSARKGVSQA